MEDDLDDILNESAKEFDKKLVIEEKKQEPVHSDSSNPPNPADLLKDLDFEKLGFNKEEFEKANDIFSNMMKDFNGADAP